MSSHGLTLFVAPSKNFPAMPIQYLGLFDGSNNGNTSNHIFAVELDTWQNIDFGDINNNHVGIDVNGLTSVRSYPAGFFHDQNGTFRNLTLSSQEAMQVWVEYDRENVRNKPGAVCVHDAGVCVCATTGKPDIFVGQKPTKIGLMPTKILVFVGFPTK
jgi:hypothetical protein